MNRNSYRDIDKTREKNYSYLVVIYFLFLVSIIFYYFTNPENIADYYSYLILIDNIYYFYDPSQIYYEPASTLLLYSSRIFSGDSVNAVSFARYFTTFILIISIYIFAKWKNVSTTSLIFIVAIFGPLLAFVTIRATPAYMLIALAALDANEGRRRAIVWSLMALQFHVSAALAFPAILISLVQNRTNFLSFIEKSLNGVIIFLVIVGAVFIFFGQSFSNVMLQSVNQIGFFTKYIAYVGVLDQSNISNNNVENSSKIYHQIYLIISFIFLAFILFLKDKNCIKFRSYAIISFGVFIFMQFSPVTAFRFSLFWIIPGLFLIPWNTYFRKDWARAVIIICSLGAFIFQVRGIVM
jgi:hypothetical protein